MKRGSLLIIIVVVVVAVAVAAWPIFEGSAGAAASQFGTPPLAAQIAALIRRNAGNTETVTFEHGGQSVAVVRGGRPSRPRIAAPPTGFAQRPAGTRVEIVSFAAGFGAPVTVLRGAPVEAEPAASPSPPALSYPALFGAARGADLDRVAFAVDSAESNHGADPGMWRAELAGPQGPMQVSRAAAIDSGGGDRFDLIENRLLGRAYLAQLYRRYGDWADAIAAYNWGPGNLDAWIAKGRPGEGLPLAVERYRDRVLLEGGIGPGLGAGSPPARGRLQPQ